MVEPSSAAEDSTPVDQILFHVRVIDPWRPLSPAQQQGRWSFFGLELELRGRRPIATNGDEQASHVLDFSSSARPGQREVLREILAPFTVTVVSKMPLDVAADHQKPLLQLLVPVQTHNTLARINKIHFLKQCATGADIFHVLERVVDAVSVAKPFEMTFLRHNHAQAAAKIRPFAARADVQKAQVAQFQKLQADESQWPVERKRRKQFVLQQMDFYRERYLYDHVGSQLQSLHEEIMGGGQWHAYEFEKALWYYHAPTGNLYAEHPMRNNEKTRQLIGGVLLRTRTAARQLQHGTRRFLRVNRAANAATQQVLGTVADEVLAAAFAAAWESRITSTYVDHLKASIGKTAKVKKLWTKWGQRGVIKAEPSIEARAEAPSLESLPDRSHDEEALADQAAERILDIVCDEVIGSSILAAWEGSKTEAIVNLFESNTTKAAKAKNLWKKWSKHAIEQAKAEEARRLAHAEDKLASDAVERVLDALFTELSGSSIVSAWETSVADSYVGHLKSNATKAAKAKRLWEKWSRHSAAQAKAEQQQLEAEEQLAHGAAERVLNLICDEVLRISIDRAWEASVVETYVGHLKANTTKAAKAKKLWETWGRHGIAQAKAEPPVSIVQPPPPQLPQVPPPPELPAVTQSSPPPPSEPRVHRNEVSSPESVEAELLIATESRAIAITPELPKIARNVAVELTAAGRLHKDDDDDDEDEEDARNWRSRLRLLKQHQRARRKKSPKRKATPNRHSNLVVAPRPLAGPVLLDRSSLLLDLATEDPYTSNAILSSLREARRSPATVYDDLVDQYDDNESNVLATSGEWRRDGSFRTFHAFFNSTPSTSLLIRQHHQQRGGATTLSPKSSKSLDKYASAPSPTLPKMALRSPQPAHSMVTSYMPPSAPPVASYASDKPATSSLALPKRLPYIRRRKPRE